MIKGRAASQAMSAALEDEEVLRDPGTGTGAARPARSMSGAERQGRKAIDSSTR
jgi:hypothetical protein